MCAWAVSYELSSRRQSLDEKAQPSYSPVNTQDNGSEALPVEEARLVGGRRALSGLVLSAARMQPNPPRWHV